VSALRAANLASAFQEVLTAIVRVRFRLHQVQEAQAFRSQIRRSLQASMQQARTLGYSGENVQAAVFATVAFLDESVLNLQDPVFGDWARQPLQEELFGGHLAGENFFRNLRACLARQDSNEIADVLEVHCLCLLMGYRGRYALGDSGELHAMLRQTRERIEHIRGQARLLPHAQTAAPVLGHPHRDRWSRRLIWTACILAAVSLAVFSGYEIALTTGASLVHSRAHQEPA
jgi:type VI secretion system protein ImpK